MHRARFVAAGATNQQLEESVPILERRLRVVGIDGARLTIADGRIDVVSRSELPTEQLEAIAGRGTFEFRAVVDGPVPADAEPTAADTSFAPGVPYCESLVAEADGTEWRYDRAAEACYLVGPSLMPDINIVSARATHQFREWIVEVEFGDDRFVDLVAVPYVGQRVAIVLDGVVQSAPTINEGITGRNVQISGGFTEQEAEGVAAVLSIDQELPVAFEIVGGDPTPTTVPSPTTDSRINYPPPTANQDHWHAAFGVNVCGTWLPDPPEFHSRADEPDLAAGIHTHGDGLIHIHPYSFDESGELATLRRFLEFGGWIHSNDGLDLWAPSEQCGVSVNPTLRYFVNGEPVDDALDRPFEDQDLYVIAIGGTGDPGSPPSVDQLAGPGDG